MTEDPPEKDLVRIVFTLEADAWHGSATERLWAEPTDGGFYRLRNTPFFVFGVSAEDVVSAERGERGLSFVEAVDRGGHSTYRIRRYPETDDNTFRKYWMPLQELGCSYEGGPVLAVDVPPLTDIHEAFGLLEAGQQAGAWDFEEGHCGHAV